MERYIKYFEWTGLVSLELQVGWKNYLIVSYFILIKDKSLAYSKFYEKY